MRGIGSVDGMTFQSGDNERAFIADRGLSKCDDMIM